MITNTDRTVILELNPGHEQYNYTLFPTKEIMWILITVSIITTYRNT